MASAVESSQKLAAATQAAAAAFRALATAAQETRQRRETEALADAVRRGQAPELIDQLKRALTLT